jgi:hypothetical protein
MKKLPLGIQTFKDIITGEYLYADKTQYIYDLINNAKCYFLSRPRRFGKSLLLDTIKEVFGGDKELFKGLWIYDSDHEFAKHPVIRFDMSNIANETPEILKESIMACLDMSYFAEGLELVDSNPADAFKRLIMLLHGKYNERVVVLIDEYDKPILDHITDTDTAEANRQVIKGFYGILKSMDAYLRMVFITGVTKFTKTSIFSELNNLFDITLTEKFANICGIETSELETHFGEHIRYISTLGKFRHYGNITDEILAWYDGYSWDGKTRVLNPFSLITFFMQERFVGYWYESGSPKFLIDLVRQKPGEYTNLNKLELMEYMLDTMDIKRIEIEPLLFQTGYLTIKEVRQTQRSPVYLVDMPNFEVREAFNLQVIAALTGSDNLRTRGAYTGIVEALRLGDLQGMLDVLRGLFASIPYQLHIPKEAYYHSIFYALMNVIGLDIRAEVSVAKGRVDAVVELEDRVYVMEFKYENCPPEATDEQKQKLFEKTLAKAMEQIDEKGYCDRYLGSGRAAYKVAFAFLGRDDIQLNVDML